MEHSTQRPKCWVSSACLHPHPHCQQRLPRHAPRPSLLLCRPPWVRLSSSLADVATGRSAAMEGRPTQRPVPERAVEVAGRCGRWHDARLIHGAARWRSSVPRYVAMPTPSRRKSLLGLRGEGAEQAAGSVEPSFELCLVRLCVVLHACALRHARAHWRPRKRVAAVEGALRRGRPPRHRGEEARWD
jgi:hypothetical protein